MDYNLLPEEDLEQHLYEQLHDFAPEAPEHIWLRIEEKLPINACRWPCLRLDLIWRQFRTGFIRYKK